MGSGIESHLNTMNKSAEEHIKTIYLLEERIGSVRSVDIAREMSFSKASVSVAMQNLRKKNVISMKENGEIELTPQGEEAFLSGKRIRSSIISKVLKALRRL